MTTQIGLFGFGVVGQGLYEILAQKNGTAPGRITRICVRDRAKPRSLPPGKFTFNPEDIFSDPDITHIVEATDRPDDAFGIVRRGLLMGKTVVSANKKMLAERLPELLHLQRASGSRLLYEASAGGSIPIFRNLEQFYRHDQVRGIRGVLNGSTNFMLSRMTDEGMAFPEALALAQQSGFAESDPTLDVDAHDPAYKLVLLIHQAFGKILAPESVLRLGIRHISAEDVEFAAQHSRKIRLLATAEPVPEGKIRAHILPALVPPRDPFFNLHDEYNGIQIQTFFTENQMLTGKGAGSLPTGFAVLSDLNASLRQEFAPARLLAATVPTQNHLQHVAVIYWRCPDPGRRGLLRFQEILEETHLESGFRVVGRIGLDALAAAAGELGQSRSFVATM